MLAADRFGLIGIPMVEVELLASFDCGKPHLNDFLRQDALALSERRLGFTSVVFHEDVDGVVGYFTLANDGLPLTNSECFSLGLSDHAALTSFPAVKIGRLAIRKELQGQGVGHHILNLIQGLALDSGSPVASRLIVVDADNEERVLHFYESAGFQRSLWSENRVKHHGGRGRPATVKMHRDVLAPG